MALEMRGKCERCGVGLSHDGAAFICSYECTFCPACTAEMHHVCPNCEGGGSWWGGLGEGEGIIMEGQWFGSTAEGRGDVQSG